MHSSEATAPAGGPGLLLQLGRLILRARSASSPAPPTPPTPRHKHKPGTSQQVLIQSQPTTDEEDDRLEDMFRNHVNALWTENVPICVEVILAPSCAECAEGAGGAGYPLRGLLLERWTMTTVLDKSESPAAISSPWLLNAVRSQLHFSQLAAWRARTLPAHAHLERRRKLSREINIKKIEANVDERELNVVYSVRAPPEAVAFATPPAAHTFPLTDIGSGKYLKVILESLPRLQDIPEVPCACRPPHTPHPPHPPPDELALRLNDLTIGSRKFEGAINSNIGTPSRRLSIISSPGSDYFLKDKLLDDRMHTNCSENGKHKCNCDEESDTKEKNLKKLDERRIKEIAKYRRRIRKENRKFCDSTSSEGELKKETTSIPILQAARFDRFRAIGCYRNQTYLTLPATRMETKSPFVNTDSIIPPEFKTKTIATQTDFTCPCGNPMEMKCDSCVGMVRSDGSYNLSSLQENGTRRKLDDGHLDQSLKKQKCDNINSVSCNGLIKRPKLRRFFPIVDKLEKIVSDRNRNTEKDIQELHLKTDDSVFSTLRESQKSDVESNSQYHNVKEPLRTEPKEIELKYSNCNDSRNSEINSCDYIPVYEKSKNLPEFTENLFTSYKNTKIPSQYAENKFSTDKECKSVQDTDGHVSTQKESKRQKTFSISDDDYVLYEKCDYGTIDRHEIDSPNEERPDFKFSSPESQLNGTDNLESSKDEFIFPDPKPSEEPSPSELDRFRCGFDSAASMLFHAKTGLPLTSSPAPLRRGNNCFDFDDSINGISGIKSALFAPLSPSPSPCPSSAPAPSPARPPPPRHRREGKKPTSSGLLGSFEESALQGRLEAVATVHGFTAELGASGAFCPPHKRLPVTVFFYAPGGTAAPYMGHINLGPGGYRVARSGSVQVSLFNPHGTLVKMFVVLYDLTRMPPAARTFLRQRTLHQAPQATRLRYLIHLRFMTSKSGKLYLHTDIRLIVSRKADLDTAVSHAGPPRPLPLNPLSPNPLSPNPLPQRAPNRVFGGSSEHDSETEFGYDSSLSYDLRSVTCAPDNPKYSPR